MKSARFLLILTGLALAFVFGLVHLLNLRFKAGDVYPVYSSLRTDPLGAKAFYESLANLPGFHVRRNYQPFEKLDDETRQTIFLFGIPAEEARTSSEDELRVIENMANAGDRIVVTILPLVEAPRPVRKLKTKKKEDKAGSDVIDLDKRWGYAFAYSEDATNKLWHTQLYFDKLDPKWDVLESRGEFPAVIERHFGKGSVILCADSFFVSNEAMRQERRPELLATLVGQNHDIVFDETHLGVGEDPGVMTLMRKYRLHGLLFGLLLLAGLFVWKNAASFVPPHEDTGTNGAALADGKDSAAGFVNLVRRSIPASELLPACVAEWKKSLAHTLPASGGRRERVDAVLAEQQALPARQRNPLGAYRQIAEILKKRKNP